MSYSLFVYHNLGVYMEHILEKRTEKITQKSAK